MQFKELTITKKSAFPQLCLNGKWLEELGFTVGRYAEITFDDGCMTLTLDDGSDLFMGDIQVESRMIRKKPRTYIDIYAYRLHRYGFTVGDKVGLTLEHGKIQIQKINKYTIAEQSA